MAIMQVAVVACLGVTETPGRSVVKPQNDLPDVLLSRRGLIRARAKLSFSLWDHLVKMLPTERSRRDEEVSVGFTSIGVTVPKL